MNPTKISEIEKMFEKESYSPDMIEWYIQYCLVDTRTKEYLMEKYVMPARR